MGNATQVNPTLPIAIDPTFASSDFFDRVVVAANDARPPPPPLPLPLPTSASIVTHPCQLLHMPLSTPPPASANSA